MGSEAALPRSVPLRRGRRAAIGPPFGYHPQQEPWKMANLHPDDSKIQPYHFYSSRADKTKFNWFAFELACEIERAVPFQLKKRLAKNGYRSLSRKMSLFQSVF
jgi:hypothetical protein